MTDKLDMTSPDLVSQNIEKIAALFPNCVTESANGLAIDFDMLKQELSNEVVEGNKERYRLEWPGKREAIVTANLPINKTLRPCREESVDFDTTENLYIEGDNLEVLKLLQESYLGKIKMIYIDPPYNTGKDFVYKDNFTQDTDEYQEEAGLKDEYNNRLVANPDTSGRYHSDWLTMIYPRLKLARNLLTDDGVIFISIDDNEVHNLRKISDEVFGEGNFISEIVWERSYAPINMVKHFSKSHDYALCYAKNLDSLECFGLLRPDSTNAKYGNPDNDPRGLWRTDNLSVGPVIESKVYEIITPNGRKCLPPKGRCWLYTRERYEEMVSDNRIWFGEKGDNIPAPKRFLSEVKQGLTPMTIWKYTEVGHNQDSMRELREIFDGEKIFDYSKPVKLIKQMLQLYTSSNDIILDFFSGSATTAHSVIQLNSEDGGKRKHIMVQVPERTDEKSEAFKAGYDTICEIGKERIRRAGKLIVNETNGKLLIVNGQLEKEQEKLRLEQEKLVIDEDNINNLQLTIDNLQVEINNLQLTINNLDVGFRVYKLDSSNMQEVYYTPTQLSQDLLSDLEDNIKPDRNADDLVAQIMLDLGLPLSLKIEETTIAGKNVFKVDDDALLCCFDEGIDEAFAKEIAKHKFLRIVFKDKSFKDDTAKENVKQLLKQLSPDSEMKVI